MDDNQRLYSFDSKKKEAADLFAPPAAYKIKEHQ